MKKRQFIQPILWTERPIGAVMGAGSLWPTSYINIVSPPFQVECSGCQRLQIDNGDPNPTTNSLLQVSREKLNEFFS
jgi:hypothetical protein